MGVNERVSKHRNALRAEGLRPLQIWVPDTRQPGFQKACREQAERAAQADQADTSLIGFADAALADIDDS
ncbi:MAG: hypothetical protein HLUCCA04_09220 [Oceanicaulis sp. HLUCCA04]|nr:MAG: hypothetical protein HLUCCA04_09220 [Oceanicaulis sp. HLUCCA04]